jgi:hypothetical protein
MSPNRVVALLTPLVFAPLAGAIAAWLAKHFPGAEVRAADLQEIFIGGALIALAPAAQWLHGWQQHEARQADAEREVALATAAAAAQPAADQEADEFDEFDELDEFGELDDELLTDEQPALT